MLTEKELYAKLGRSEAEDLIQRAHASNSINGLGRFTFILEARLDPLKMQAVAGEIHTVELSLSTLTELGYKI